MEWPDGVERLVLERVDSTLSEAGRIAGTLSAPTWILALEQTAARGRRGRAWAMPKGNFAATYIMQPVEQPEQVALRTFVASLALNDAFVAATGRPDSFTLKWPNDVLLNGGKVAGILLERTGAGHLSVGIGINLAGAPSPADVEPGAVRPVSLVGETGVAIPPEDFLDLLAPAYAHWEAQFTTFGFAPIRTAWLARAARLGEAIRARTVTGETIGTFETVDETGQLVLSTAKSRVAIPAADVFFEGA
ncbi:MAG: biotin--[acetyl-CoA-carboxylase] ligase [Pseudomonadota bacterium]